MTVAAAAADSTVAAGHGHGHSAGAGAGAGASTAVTAARSSVKPGPGQAASVRVTLARSASLSARAAASKSGTSSSVTLLSSLTTPMSTLASTPSSVRDMFAKAHRSNDEPAVDTWDALCPNAQQAVAKRRTLLETVKEYWTREQAHIEELGSFDYVDNSCAILALYESEIEADKATCYLVYRELVAENERLERWWVSCSA
jgi:hypothetical protein